MLGSRGHKKTQERRPFKGTKSTTKLAKTSNIKPIPFMAFSQLPQLDAVIIRDLTYEIGTGSKRRVILNRINLTVREGTIYGLLGPSGCGKTTMLRCVVGRIKPRAGSVLVFGLRPSGGLGEVPGRDVGYMPQDISIYEDFTIEETLHYFGKINRMQTIDVKRRVDFLLHFLDLPMRSRVVANLSGGQKRRVSLAAALVHSPPLLILDEPTVGVDPLLRQNIWRHLVTLTKRERISVIITTHYIEEARLANVVGLMRYGKILAENSPDELMHIYGQSNLEDVFLKLCMSDSTARRMSSIASRHSAKQKKRVTHVDAPSKVGIEAARNIDDLLDVHKLRVSTSGSRAEQPTNSVGSNGRDVPIRIHTGTNKIEINHTGGHVNEAVEVFSSEDERESTGGSLADYNFRDHPSESKLNDRSKKRSSPNRKPKHRRHFEPHDENDDDEVHHMVVETTFSTSSGPTNTSGPSSLSDMSQDDYLAMQAMQWSARRTNAVSLMQIGLDKGPYNGLDGRKPTRGHGSESGLNQWWRTLMAVTWKNYLRLRRNPPVLIFQFLLPAVQVILFCLCIGGEPFDVPVAIVNEESVPKSSVQFLNGLNEKIVRQIKYDNLSSAIEAVRRGKVWGAIHIPERYSENLQSRLIMGEEVTKETIENGTIRVFPDLTNLHLAMTLETTFRETFVKFARDSIEELGYDRSLADLPIQMGKPVYGTMRKDGYLEFMAPGVVISISYVMATGLTALAFILERRDGLLERSLVSGVQTSQILLAHAINQVIVMVIQIFLVLGCTFFIFEIPSRGPFFWVVLLILLQGCTGMSFGLLVSAICKEENTAVMMVVGTFYTNLILAGIIWPIEAMPHWIRPVSYSQPQTLPTDTLRHILSRGWGIGEPGVQLGFAVTLGWLVVFLLTAGIIFKQSG